MRFLLTTIAAGALLTGVAMAQSGPINVVTVNPRENADLANTTGTETGQPTDMDPKSYNMSNGLNPVTTNMSGYGSNGNMNQAVVGAKGTPASNEIRAKEEPGQTQKKEGAARKK